MSKDERATAAVPPPTPDLWPLMLGPLTVLRLWADMSRSASSLMPASLLIASSPFFWAPPLWVGALMAAHSAHPHGGAEGSAATAREAAAAPKRTVAPAGRARRTPA